MAGRILAPGEAVNSQGADAGHDDRSRLEIGAASAIDR